MFQVPQDAKSWIPVKPESHFPIQNIPFGIAKLEGRFELVTRVGDVVIRLAKLAEAGQIPVPVETFAGPEPTQLRIRRSTLSAWRKLIFDLLHTDAKEPLGKGDGLPAKSQAMLSATDAPMHVPKIGAFVDFYSGIHHASNVGKMFRPDQPPLLPNYRWLPIGYNGRASSVYVSGTDIARPSGLTKAPDQESPSFGPTAELDFELEIGFLLGEPDKSPIPIDQCEDQMLGLYLVNDWSARDVQRFEYQPLGPFLAKSFATSISPWLVTLDALERFKTPGMPQEPEPLPHLLADKPGAWNIHLEVLLKTQSMGSPERISQTNADQLYWSAAQQLAHQSSNGTPLQAGDLYASGTISGSEPGTFGSLLELSWRGSKPVSLANGESRSFLQDGDELILTGFCQGEGYRVGFGECAGKVESP